MSHWAGRASILKRIRGRQMKKFLALAAVLFLTACGAYETDGMGMINGNTVDISLIEKASGMTIAGYDLGVNGEPMGLLELDESDFSNPNKQVLEFKTVQTKYGEFDLTRTTVVNWVDPTHTFRLTLNGELVATIQRSVM